MNMYIGESEASIRQLFKQARSASPCVIFFDELDSIAPKRGEQGGSGGGVMDRIVSQLLAELDDMAQPASTHVFVIGATNRPDLLDPSLLRPGRFDKLIYLSPPMTRNDQLHVLKAQARRLPLADDVDLEAALVDVPLGRWTGADFYALCHDAVMGALRRCVESMEQGQAVDKVLVTQHDLCAAASRLMPSVSADEMEHYRLLQSSFQNETSKRI